MPTFAAAAMLHLRRMAAICAADDHLIEQVNGGFGPNLFTFGIERAHPHFAPGPKMVGIGRAFSG